MRINLRLTDKDADIAALFQAIRPSDVVRNVVRASIEGRHFLLSAPPASAAGGAAVHHIRLDNKNDRDVIGWLQNVQKGQVSNVLKILIRHSMDQPGIVQYMLDGSRIQPVQPAQPRGAVYSVPARTEPLHSPQTGTSKPMQAESRRSSDTGSAEVLNPGAGERQKPKKAIDIDPLSII